MTPHNTQDMYITKARLLKRCRKMLFVCSQNYTSHINTVDNGLAECLWYLYTNTSTICSKFVLLTKIPFKPSCSTLTLFVLQTRLIFHKHLLSFISAINNLVCLNNNVKFFPWIFNVLFFVAFTNEDNKGPRNM